MVYEIAAFKVVDRQTDRCTNSTNTNQLAIIRNLYILTVICLLLPVTDTSNNSNTPRISTFNGRKNERLTHIIDTKADVDMEYDDTQRRVETSNDTQERETLISPGQ